MESEPFPTEWLRAILPLAVLSAVAKGETYGYAIAEELKIAGLGTVKGGTLYPILNRLEDQGLVTSSWREGLGGPGRKFFIVTRLGCESVHSRVHSWHAFTERAARLLPDVRSTQ